jgi:hypothetical protein
VGLESVEVDLDSRKLQSAFLPSANPVRASLAYDAVADAAAAAVDLAVRALIALLSLEMAVLNERE